MGRPNPAVFEFKGHRFLIQLRRIHPLKTRNSVIEQTLSFIVVPELMNSCILYNPVNGEG
jgi:hypothetical protein